MILGKLLIFCSIFLWASAAPEPDVNIKIDIKVNGESISGGGFKEVKCGITRPYATRIINGEPVTSTHKYSWQVGLSPNDAPNYSAVCGGSIITKKHILTAAHCYDNTDKNFKYFIGIGSNKEDNTIIIISQESVHLNKKYKSTGVDYDTAIIVLSQSIDLLKNDISPICIPKDDSNNYVGINATISGWGSTKGYNPEPTPHPKPESSNILLEAKVPVLDNAICLRKDSEFKEDIMLCAGDMVGFLNGGKDTCQGDSGGPLTIGDNGQYQQIGIVSFGSGCASKGYPGYYARVTAFLDWINENVAPEKIYTAS